ncbi:MAG: type II secretion system protein [Pyrinomonadaceae bacterium]
MVRPNEQVNSNSGFSLIELLVVMTLMLIVLSLVSMIFGTALSTRERESEKTDALTSVQSALNLMSREIANSGYGLTDNGIVTSDSNSKLIHFRANVENDDLQTNDIGEEIAYFYDPDTDSVVRFDRFAAPQSSIVINRVANVTFKYLEYAGNSTVPIVKSTPTSETAAVRITLMVELDNFPGQPDNQNVSSTTEVSLRNSRFLLNKY